MQSNIASHTKHITYFMLFNETPNSGEPMTNFLTFRKWQNFKLYDEHIFLAVINTHRFLVVINTHRFLAVINTHRFLGVINTHRFLAVVNTHRYLAVIKHT